MEGVLTVRSHRAANLPSLARFADSTSNKVQRSDFSECFFLRASGIIPATRGGKGFIWLTWNKHGESKRRKRARGEEHTCDFFSRVFARRYFRGGYVDDANPSASEQQAARAMVPVWHSMRAGSKARDLGDRSVGVVGRVGGGAIRESAEWQRF
jgi:hypothetical protein